MFISILSAVLISANLTSAMSNEPTDVISQVAKEAVDCKTISDPEARLRCFDELFSTEPKAAKQLPAQGVDKNDVAKETIYPKQDTAQTKGKLTEPSESISNSSSQTVKAAQGNTSTVIAPVVSSKMPTNIENDVKDDSVVKAQDDKMVKQFGGEEFAKSSNEPEALKELAFTVSQLSQTLRKKQIFEFSNGQVWQNRTNKKIKIDVGDEVVIKEGILGSFYMQKKGLNRKIAVERMK